MKLSQFGNSVSKLTLNREDAIEGQLMIPVLLIWMSSMLCRRFPNIVIPPLHLLPQFDWGCSGNRDIFKVYLRGEMLSTKKPSNIVIDSIKITFEPNQ